MRKDCLGFHQFETIALMPCFSVNFLVEESGVFCQFFFLHRKINVVPYPTLSYLRFSVKLSLFFIVYVTFFVLFLALNYYFRTWKFAFIVGCSDFAVWRNYRQMTRKIKIATGYSLLYLHSSNFKVKSFMWCLRFMNVLEFNIYETYLKIGFPYSFPAR